MSKALQSVLTLDAHNDGSAKSDQAVLLQEIRALRQQLQSFSASSIAPAAASQPQENDKPQLRITLDRIVGERKPFVLRCHGVFDFELSLSTMRAALLLALLLDIHDRSAGGGPFSNLMGRMLELYRALDGTDASDEQVASLVRVGLYRLELSLVDTPLFNGENFKLIFNAQQHRLEIKDDSKLRSLSEVSISISSSDARILSCIDTLSATSPLARAREQNSMYISSGERGWDQLFLEYFDHKQPVRNTSLFYRPALPTFPDQLLAHIKASGASIARKRVMLEGYRSGRVVLHEILNRQTLWDMITTSSDGNYLLYPAGVSFELVAAHIQEMISQLGLYDGYQLVLTDAVFPFIVGVIEMGCAPFLDSFTMFYRQQAEAHAGDTTCFVLHDPLVARSVLSRVISTVLEHPSTVSDRVLVQDELNHVLEYFQSHGPIVK